MVMIGRQLPLDLFGDSTGLLEHKFWEFHTAHPEVFRVLVFFARQWRERKGSDAQVGIGALYERARWEIWFDSLADAEPPRLSNNHRAFYSRLIMERCPDLGGIFKLKQQRIQSSFGPDNAGLPSGEHNI
jgi:hypothetical protein